MANKSRYGTLMILLENRKNGYTILLRDSVNGEQAQGFLVGIRGELAGGMGEFVLVVDTRGFRHFTADAQALFEEALAFLRGSGLVRLAVLARSTVFATQFCEMMVRAELMEEYMYIDTSYEQEWEEELAIWLEGAGL